MVGLKLGVRCMWGPETTPRGSANCHSYVMPIFREMKSGGKVEAHGCNTEEGVIRCDARPRRGGLSAD